MATTSQRVARVLGRVDHMASLARAAAEHDRPGRAAAFLVALLDELRADHLVGLRRAAAVEARAEARAVAAQDRQRARTPHGRAERVA